MTERCFVDPRLRPEPPDRIDWLYKKTCDYFASPCFHWPGEPFPYAELDRWAEEETRREVAKMWAEKRRDDRLAEARKPFMSGFERGFMWANVIGQPFCIASDLWFGYRILAIVSLAGFLSAAYCLLRFGRR